MFIKDVQPFVANDNGLGYILVTRVVLQLQSIPPVKARCTLDLWLMVCFCPSSVGLKRHGLYKSTQTTYPTQP